MLKTFVAGLALALASLAMPASAQAPAQTPAEPDAVTVQEALGLRDGGPTPGATVQAPSVKPPTLGLVDRRDDRRPVTPRDMGSPSTFLIEDGYYAVDVPDVARSSNADCEYLPGDLEVYTGSDDWSYADVEWSVYTDYGDNSGWGEIFYDDSYEFEALYWCPEDDGFGTFTVDLTITFYDFDDNVLDYVDLTDDFRVTPLTLKGSKVTFAKTKFKAHGWKFQVTAKRGGAAWRNKRVVWEAKVCGGWGELTSARANQRGRVTFRANPKAGWNKARFCGVRGSRIPMRFSVAGDATTKTGHSRVFKVSRR